MYNIPLLTESEYKLIQQLSISAKQKFRGLTTGEQRSLSQGFGIEFADYREYQPGDDIRQIDWAVYLRLRKLLIKLCAEEKELTIVFILDASKSMAYGNPEKLFIAKKIIAILTGVALKEGNRVIVSLMKDKLKEIIYAGRTHYSFSNIIKILEEIELVDNANPISCLEDFFAKYKNKCLLIFISDLLYPEWEEVLNGISSCKNNPHIIQLLSKEEINPDFLGELTLLDVENLSEISLNLNSGTKDKYKEELDNFLIKIRNKSHQKNLSCITLSTETKMERVFHNFLKEERLVC